MPFRSMSTLESWLDEFRALGHAMSGQFKVIQQDGEQGADTGLVAISLSRASTVTYIQPDVDGSQAWLVTMEPREDTVTLDADSVRELAAELAVVSALCDFLQQKSAAYLRQHAV